MLPRLSWESAYWPTATLLGFFLTYGLFLFVPTLDGHASPKEQQILELDFVQWQAPVPKAAPPPKPVKQQAIKPRPKPVVPTPKPEPIKPVEPQKPKPEPVLTEEEPEQTPPAPEPEPTPEPEQLNDAPPPVEPSQAVEEVLPMPVSLAKLTAMPRFLHKQAPVYPPNMRAIGKQATVTLKVLIDEQGTIRQVTVKKSAGEDFDQAAITAIKNSRFIAGDIDGQPVTVLLTVPIKFQLR